MNSANIIFSSAPTHNLEPQARPMSLFCVPTPPQESSRCTRSKTQQKQMKLLSTRPSLPPLPWVTQVPLQAIMRAKYGNFELIIISIKIITMHRHHFPSNNPCRTEHKCSNIFFLYPQPRSCEANLCGLLGQLSRREGVFTYRYRTYVRYPYIQ